MKRSNSNPSRMTAVIALTVLVIIMTSSSFAADSRRDYVIMYGSAGPGLDTLMANRYDLTVEAYVTDMNIIRRINPDFLWFHYISAEDAATGDRKEYIESRLAANGIDPETIYMHYWDYTQVTLQGTVLVCPGLANAVTRQDTINSRIPIYYSDRSRILNNLSSPYVRQYDKMWACEVLSTLPYDHGQTSQVGYFDGIAWDNGSWCLYNTGSRLQGGQIAEHPTHANIQDVGCGGNQWWWNSCLKLFYQGLVDTLNQSSSWHPDGKQKYSMPNIANTWTNDYAQAGTAHFLSAEFVPRWDLRNSMVIAHASRDSLAHANGVYIMYCSLTNETDGSYEGYYTHEEAVMNNTALCYVFSSPSAYLFHMPHTGVNPQQDGWDSLTWIPAMDYDIGDPLQSHYTVAGQGVDGKGYSYTIYSRQYQNAKTFFRTRGNYNEDFDPSTAVSLSLGGTYQELLPDGSLGIPASSASFRNGQGRIMLPFSSNDAVAPGPINLDAEPGENPGTIRLSWTETGDDGYTGNATYTTIKYSTSPITTDNWIQVTAVPNPPTPSTPNQPVVFEIQGLTPGELYYIGIQTYDEAGLGSGIAVASSAAQSDGGSQQDTVRPGQIIDLDAEIGAIDGSVELNWTATGDDGGTGTASSYEIRYFTDSLAESDWLAASHAYPLPPAPQPAGYPENIVIDNLVSGQTYWFSIIATDEAGNSSDIAFTSGYARGIRTPSLAADTIIVDTILGEATLFATTVESYLDIVYEFQVATASSFDDFETSIATDVTGAYARATFTGLSVGTDYYGRVRAVAAYFSQASNWSAPVRFDLANGVLNQPPSVPVASSPLDGDTITTLAPTLVVNNSTDPEGDMLTYDMELYDPAVTALISSAAEIPSGSQTTAWEIADGLLSADTWYSWRARAFDGDLYSGWTQYERFYATRLSADDIAGSGDVYVYPNPVRFAQGEQATFVLPEEPRDLLIMSVSGATVLIKRGLSNSWIWDGKNTSGNAVAAAVYLWYVVGTDFKGKIMVKP